MNNAGIDLNAGTVRNAGIVLIVAGVLWALIAFNMETSVEVGGRGFRTPIPFGASVSGTYTLAAAWGPSCDESKSAQ
jgi:hypothetical protein